MKHVLILLFALFAGCATDPKMVQTNSGKPEVVIAATTEQLKSKILSDWARDGYVPKSDTPMTLVLSKRANVGQAMAASIAWGSQVIVSEELLFSFSVDAGGKTRVIVFPALTGSNGGRMEMGDAPKWFNPIQGYLWSLESSLTTKAKTESGRPEVIVASTDLPTIKSWLLDDARKHQPGYIVDLSTEQTFDLSRPLSGDEARQAVVKFGGGASENRRYTTYGFSPVDGGMRIVAATGYKAKFPDGSVKTISVEDDPRIFNGIIDGLNQLRGQFAQKPPAP